MPRKATSSRRRRRPPRPDGGSCARTRRASTDPAHKQAGSEVTMKSPGYVRLGVGLVLSTLIACGGAPSGPSSPSEMPEPAVPSAPRGGEMIFSDDFESRTLDAWQDGVNPSKQRVVTGDAQSGNHYLAVTYPAGADGGWLTRFFMPGYQTMYVSLYVRFPRGWSGGTKLVGFYGSRVDDQWSAFGKA